MTGRAVPAERIDRLVLIGIVVLAGAVGLFLAWRPFDYLVSHPMPDDAFYYFQTARNITHGRGVSVDGEHWGNGFHPLWLVMVLPWIANASGERPAARWLAAVAGAGAISYSILIASDPLQYVVGTMYNLDPPTWVWALYWILYVPVLFAIAWYVEQASRALAGTSGRRALSQPREVTSASTPQTPR